MLPCTVYLGRLLGLFRLILGVAECTQRFAMVKMATEVVNAPARLLLSGMATVVAGLTIVLAHNVWRGGAMPVLVTIFGWLLLIKGTALLVVPVPGWADASHTSHYADYYPIFAATPLILGVYLTFAGFAARRP